MLDQEAIRKIIEELHYAIPHMATKDMIERFRKEPENLMKEAFTNNMELGAYLNRACPYDGIGNPELDGFNRFLEAEGLIVKTDSEEGIYASPLKDWLGYDPSTGEEKHYRRAAFHEYTRRKMQGVINKQTQSLMPVLPKEMEDQFQKESSGFTSLDVAAGTFLRPYARGEDQYDERPELVINLNDITRGIISITGADMKSLVFENAKGRFPTFRFTEYGNIPTITADTREITTEILKHGVGIEMSYEWIRRNGNIGIDQFALWMSQIAIYWQLDEISDGLQTLLSPFTRSTDAKEPIAWGAQHTGTIPTGTYEHLDSKTALDGDNPASTTNPYILDIRSWLNLRKYFTGEDTDDDPPKIYQLTNIFARRNMVTDVEMLPIGQTNIRLQELFYDRAAGTIERLPRQVTADGIRYGWTGKGGIKNWDTLSIDRNWAMNYIVEIGSDISETEKFIRNQTNLWTISKNYGFDLFDEDAIVLVRNNYWAKGSSDYGNRTLSSTN